MTLASIAEKSLTINLYLSFGMKDRRTIKRHYYQGKTKQTRNKPSKIDEYSELLWTIVK